MPSPEEGELPRASCVAYSIYFMARAMYLGLQGACIRNASFEKRKDAASKLCTRPRYLFFTLGQADHAALIGDILLGCARNLSQEGAEMHCRYTPCVG